MAEVQDTKASVAEESNADNDEDDRESEFAELDPMRRYGRVSSNCVSLSQSLMPFFPLFCIIF